MLQQNSRSVCGLAGDTALLFDGLLHLSRPLAGEGAQDLASEALVGYSGALAGFLRGAPRPPIDVGLMR